MTNNKTKSISIILSVAISLLFIVLITYAATTIGVNIDTGGNLTVSGNATTTGSHYIGGNLSVLGNASTTGTFTLSGIANFFELRNSVSESFDRVAGK